MQKELKKKIKNYWNLAKENPKVAMGVIIVIAIIITWVS